MATRSIPIGPGRSADRVLARGSGDLHHEPDGSDLHEVTSPGGQPSFTADGHHIVYECASSTCGKSGIFLMKDDGSDAPGLRLSRNPFPFEGDSDPQVSPNGETVTFVRHKVEGELQALMAVDIDGSDLRMIAPYTLEVAIKHDWAPDGENIVITINADYPNSRNPNIATIEPDGSDLDVITNIHRELWEPSPAPTRPTGDGSYFGCKTLITASSVFSRCVRTGAIAP